VLASADGTGSAHAVVTEAAVHLGCRCRDAVIHFRTSEQISPHDYYSTRASQGSQAGQRLLPASNLPDRLPEPLETARPVLADLLHQLADAFPVPWHRHVGQPRGAVTSRSDASAVVSRGGHLQPHELGEPPDEPGLPRQDEEEHLQQPPFVDCTGHNQRQGRE
jgi:hypothetical protein